MKRYFEPTLFIVKEEYEEEVTAPQSQIGRTIEGKTMRW